MAQRLDGREPIPEIDPFTDSRIYQAPKKPAYELLKVPGLPSKLQYDLVGSGGGFWYPPPTYKYHPGTGPSVKSRDDMATIQGGVYTTNAAKTFNSSDYQKARREAQVAQARVKLPLAEVTAPSMTPVATTSSSSSSRSPPEVKVAMASSSTVTKTKVKTSQVDRLSGFYIQIIGDKQVVSVGGDDYFKIEDSFGTRYEYAGNKNNLKPKSRQRVQTQEDRLNDLVPYSQRGEGQPLGGKSSGLSTILEGWTPVYEEAKQTKHSTPISSEAMSGFKRVVAFRERDPKMNVIPENKVSPSLKMSNSVQLGWGRTPTASISSYLTGRERPERSSVNRARALSVEMKDALNRGKRLFALWTINMTEGRKALIEIYGDMGTPELYVNGEKADIEYFRTAVKRNRRNLADSIRNHVDASNIKIVEDYLKIETKRIPDYEAMKAGFKADIRRASAAGDRATVNGLLKELSKLEKRAAMLKEITKEDKQITLPYTDHDIKGYACQKLFSEKDLDDILFANDIDTVAARDAIFIMCNTHLAAIIDTAIALTRQDVPPEDSSNVEIRTLYNAVRGLVPPRRFIKAIEVDPVVIKKSEMVYGIAPAHYELAPQQPLRPIEPNPMRGTVDAYNRQAEGTYAPLTGPAYPFITTVNRDGKIYDERGAERFYDDHPPKSSSSAASSSLEVEQEETH